jgi:hypothetical protein
VKRRALLSGLLALPVALRATQAWAGSYLDRAALLLTSSRKDAEALRKRMTDKELARVVKIVSEARQTAASKMDVPAVVAKAHPHLLLALTRVERAATSALDGNFVSVLEHLESAKTEETIFRSALKELGHPLPSAT